ncbi:MAG: cupin domain-containing protein [Rhodanobacteraceae bacterium]
MNDNPTQSVAPDMSVAQVVVPCSDLDASLAFFVDRLGFRLDMIMPADAPRVAEVSGHGLSLRLDASDDAPIPGTPISLRLLCESARWQRLGTHALHGPDGVRVEWIDRDAPIALPDGTQAFVISRAAEVGAWSDGRAGMHYRDLIPDRLGGRFIASHIRIPDGGPVPDYVHHHRIRFQMIYCKAGWVRVVYEDQGPPFVMHAGDCVLQPPGIRHRVLEASDGHEVIEIGCPAVHETLRDHAMELPTAQVRPGRLFGSQRFVRHVAANADWKSAHDARWKFRDTGIADATNGLVSVRVLRTMDDSSAQRTKPNPTTHNGEFLFLFVLDGVPRLTSRALGTHDLNPGDACVIPAGADYALAANAACQILEIALPAAAAER